MRKLVLALVLASGTARASDFVTLDGGEDIGLLSASHTLVAPGYLHRWWGERAFVEARVSIARGAELTWIESRVGAGLAFHPGRRVELAIGWRVGDSYVDGTIGTAPFELHLLAVELVVRVTVELSPCWRLRATPVAPTLYWNNTYGGALALELGVERAL
jgi:hypothetical protein